MAVSFGPKICIGFPCFISIITLRFSITINVEFKSMAILELSFATIEEQTFSVDTSIVVTFMAYFGFAQHSIENWRFLGLSIS